MKKAKSSKLYPLESINFDKNWDYSLPTLYSNTADINKKQLIITQPHFDSEFKRRYGAYLSNFDYSNLLIAGGSISAIITNKEYDNDLDIFVYGLTKNQANEKLRKVINSIAESYKQSLVSSYKSQNLSEIEQHNKFATEAKIVNIRNKNCVTMKLGKTIQIIFRLYKSIDEILYGFDLGSCAVGYDGKNLYFTEHAKESYEYFINKVDPSRRSTTYERRLLKYQNRGFLIVLPDLDMEKLNIDYLKYKRNEIAELPYLVFSYNQIKDNKIFLTEIVKYGDKKYKSDYQQVGLNQHQIFYLNLREIVKESDDLYYYNESFGTGILEELPAINSKQIIDFYDALGEKLIKCGNLELKLLKNYFTLQNAKNITEAILIGSTKIPSIIEKQKKETLEKFSKLKLDKGLKWIEKDPASQISGSFNPIISSPKEWYGSYYLEK